MKALLLGAVFCAAVCLSTTLVRAQTVFSYEPGEPGLPYTGNPGIYVTSTSTTTGVTNGAQSLQTSVAAPAIFGGPGSAAFTDAVLDTVLGGLRRGSASSPPASRAR